MHLIIDGYNLLHVGCSLIRLNSMELQRERDRLIEKLSTYQKFRPCEITIVFDGWQGGSNIEEREKKRGIEIIFSRLGEKADDVIKRLIGERGSRSIVITSDQSISKYAQRFSVPVIPSEMFKERIEKSTFKTMKEEEDSEEKGFNKKGPSRRPSKKERRMRLALKKL